mgnify:CR=1 FL=1
MNLQNRTILLTGGSSGIGLELTGHLLQRGNTVIICGRSEEKLQKVKTAYPEVIIKACDLSLGSECTALIQWVLEQFPELDVLINNAGYRNLIDLKGDGEYIERARHEIATNFTAPVHLCSLVIPHFLRRGRGDIVNVSTGLVYIPKSAQSIYCAAKAALHSYTQSLRLQLRDTPIQVYEVMPPLVDTAFHSEGLPSEIKAMGVREATRAFLKGLSKGQPEILIGKSRLARLLSRFFPSLGLRILNP